MLRRSKVEGRGEQLGRARQEEVAEIAEARALDEAERKLLAGNELDDAAVVLLFERRILAWNRSKEEGRLGGACRRHRGGVRWRKDVVLGREMASNHICV